MGSVGCVPANGTARRPEACRSDWISHSFASRACQALRAVAETSTRLDRMMLDLNTSHSDHAKVQSELVALRAELDASRQSQATWQKEQKQLQQQLASAKEAMRTSEAISRAQIAVEVARRTTQGETNIEVLVSELRQAIYRMLTCLGC